MDLIQHLTRQMVFSRATFGPGARTKGVLDHIKKEIEEVLADYEAGNLTEDEGVDLVILALDGLSRAVWSETHKNLPAEFAARACCEKILRKQAINELRDWPDWRTASEDEAIEHVRDKEQPETRLGAVGAHPK